MKILLVTSEMVPFSKTGGLADVIGALPKALKELGHDVRVILPRYKMTDKSGISESLVMKLDIKVEDKTVTAEIFEARLPGSDVIVYLVSNSGYFDRDELYQVKGKDYPDNCERFIFFSKTVLAFIKALGWEPHVIHCNDWQSALVNAYIKTVLNKDAFFNTIATVYSIHNMGYLGLFDASVMPLTGLGWEYFTPDTLEFWGNVSFAKAGIVFSDVVSTVSETYAREIQTAEFGHGLDGLMRARKEDLYGIVNGVDYDIWDPSKDVNLPTKYTAANLRGKSQDKIVLRKSCSLENSKDVPVIGMVSRMSDQKGFDILSAAFERIMGLDVQFVLLGTGDPKYQNMYIDLSHKYHGKVSMNIGFDSAAAPLIYAGSDMFMMPSRYEPCGLGQLISFRYGTVPIVRATGGLADTVKDFDSIRETGDGFVFKEYSSDSLYNAVERAVRAYSDKKKWTKLVKKVMKNDFSWEVSAKQYVQLYKKAIENLRGRYKNVRTF